MSKPIRHIAHCGAYIVVGPLSDKRVAVDAKTQDGSVRWLYTFDVDAARRLRDDLTRAIENAESQP